MDTNEAPYKIWVNNSRGSLKSETEQLVRTARVTYNGVTKEIRGYKPTRSFAHFWGRVVQEFGIENEEQFDLAAFMVEYASQIPSDAGMTPQKVFRGSAPTFVVVPKEQTIATGASMSAYIDPQPEILAKAREPKTFMDPLPSRQPSRGRGGATRRRRR